MDASYFPKNSSKSKSSWKSSSQPRKNRNELNKYDPKKDRPTVAFHKARKEAIDQSVLNSPKIYNYNAEVDIQIDMGLFFSPAISISSPPTAKIPKETQIPAQEIPKSPAQSSSSTTATATGTNPEIAASSTATATAAATTDMEDGNSFEPMDLSTPQRCNKRSRERVSLRDENKFAKVRVNDESENEERDIFNNEALENPRYKESESSCNLGSELSQVKMCQTR